jgi:hypothetical protein
MQYVLPHALLTRCRHHLANLNQQRDPYSLPSSIIFISRNVR